jgi:hypothetical protein
MDPIRIWKAYSIYEQILDFGWFALAWLGLAWLGMVCLVGFF